MNLKFYESDPDLWDKINIVDLQNHYVCSVYVARLMSTLRKGLIINISSFGGIFSLFNTPYGIGKAALDRMTRETAQELREKNITVVSLYPGAVKTEMFTTKVIVDIKGHENVGASNYYQFKIKNVMQAGESCDFVGKATAALACDENVNQMTGRALMTVDLAKKYGFRDENGISGNCKIKV